MVIYTTFLFLLSFQKCTSHLLRPFQKKKKMGMTETPSIYFCKNPISPVNKYSLLNAYSISVANISRFINSLFRPFLIPRSCEDTSHRLQACPAAFGAEEKIVLSDTQIYLMAGGGGRMTREYDAQIIASKMDELFTSRHLYF